MAGGRRSCGACRSSPRCVPSRRSREAPCLRTAAGRALVLFAAAPPVAADWPQWRGPARDGRRRPRGPRRLARDADARPGRSRSGRVTPRRSSSGTASTSSAARARTRWCRPSTSPPAAPLWRQAYPAPYTMNSAATAHGKGPKSTPVVAGGRVFTFGITGILSAFDAATGRLVWRKEFGAEFGETSPLYGVAQSPVVDGRRLIAPRRRPRQRRAHRVRRRDGRRALGLEGRRPGLRLAGRGDARRRAAGRDPQRVVLVGVSADTRRAALEDPLHDALRPERRHPDRGRRPVIYSGLDQPLARGPRRAGDHGLHDRAALGERRGRQLHEHAGAGGRAPLRPLAPQEGAALLPRRGHRPDGLAVAKGGRARTPRSWRAGAASSRSRRRRSCFVLPTKGDAFAPTRRYRVASSPTWAHPVVMDGGVLVKDVTAWPYLRF